MRKVSRYESFIPLFLHSLFGDVTSILWSLLFNVFLFQDKPIWILSVYFTETGKWDIPEVMVHSNSSPWQRDHDQKDPQHYWCGNLAHSCLFLFCVSGITVKISLLKNLICHQSSVLCFCQMLNFGCSIFNLISNILRSQLVETLAMTGLNSFFRM